MIPAWLPQLLVRLGIAREVLHVDTWQRVHVRAEIVDASGAPVPDADAVLERPPQWAERAPASFSAGRSDALGRVDAHADVFWAFEAKALPAPQAWPTLALVVRKGGRERRQPVDLAALPEAAGERVLDAGRVALP